MITLVIFFINYQFEQSRVIRYENIFITWGINTNQVYVQVYQGVIRIL